jgi:hypothetical protein
MDGVAGGLPSITGAALGGLVGHGDVMGGARRESPPRPLRGALVETSKFPHVRIVRDYHVLREIGQLRHRQYVARQGKRYASAVLDRDCLIELADFSGVNIYAADGAGMSCAMRIGEVRDPHNAQAELFAQAAGRFGVGLDRAISCSRLVRAPRHSGRHVVDLVAFVRWQTVHAGWRSCIMQTAERLVPFFRKLEFFETGLWTDDPVAGRLQVLILDTAMRPERTREARHA